jgi:hypothetical protein
LYENVYLLRNFDPQLPVPGRAGWSNRQLTKLLSLVGDTNGMNSMCVDSAISVDILVRLTAEGRAADSVRLRRVHLQEIGCGRKPSDRIVCPLPGSGILKQPPGLDMPSVRHA